MSSQRRASRTATRRSGRAAPTRNPWASRLAWIVGAGSIVIVVAVILAAMAAEPPTDEVPGGSGETAITCDPGEHFTYHVHAHLTIRLDGANVPVPGRIGIGSNCIFWLHTHAEDGILHVEAPSERTFTLGQFFEIWGQPLTTSQVATTQVGEGQRLSVFVDGQPFEGDPSSIELADQRAIELQVGAGPVDPLPYSFPPEYR
jgi:hypothetical protein